MTVNPIYEPKGAAKEYVDGYALNIYTGCPHHCFYCYAPQVLHKDRRTFHSDIRPRDGIVEAVKKQLEKTGMAGKTVHLCFTCDPYPTGYDSSATREIIRLLKESGNHVQILTKGDGTRDFDLLDGGDWYGVTYDGTRRGESAAMMEADLAAAKQCGIRTWVSCEPVLYPGAVLTFLSDSRNVVDRVKIGKLNYHQPPEPIDWGEFGRKAEALCRSLGLDYYIKDSLRKEMEKGG